MQNWFDEGTRNKIHILGKNPGDTLRNLVDTKDLPKPYGGDLEWEFSDEPSLDEQAKKVLGMMPKGPAMFVDGTVVRPGEVATVDQKE
jgi:hypothetical protein